MPVNLRVAASASSLTEGYSGVTRSIMQQTHAEMHCAARLELINIELAQDLPPITKFHRVCAICWEFFGFMFDNAADIAAQTAQYWAAKVVLVKNNVVTHKCVHARMCMRACVRARPHACTYTCTMCDVCTQLCRLSVLVAVRHACSSRLRLMMLLNSTTTKKNSWMISNSSTKQTSVLAMMISNGLLVLMLRKRLTMLLEPLMRLMPRNRLTMLSLLAVRRSDEHGSHTTVASCQPY